MDLIHNVRAIAFHNLGQEPLAKQSLDLSEQAIAKWIGGTAAEQNNFSMKLPWFDLVEGIVLHREASKKVTGRENLSEEYLSLLRDRALATVSEGM